MMDSRFSATPAHAPEPASSQREDRGFSLRKILPSRRALLLLLIPLAMLEFFLHLVRQGEIAEHGFQPPVGPVEHIVYGSIFFYSIFVLMTMFVKAIYYLIRATFLALR